MGSRRAAIALLLGLAVACGGEPARLQPVERPNLVLIIGDDHGWPDAGFMGSEIVRTPNLDALARGGVVFTHAFNTDSSCRPSLLTFLTGLHPLQIESRAALNGPAMAVPGTPTLIRQFETLPRVLSTRGYASHQSGKHWEGAYQDAGFTRGTAKGLGGEDLPPPRVVAGGSGLGVGRDTMQPVFRFIDSHRDEPFLVWFAPMLPHKPHDAPEEFRAPYANAGLDPATQAYYANVTRLDARVGELVAHLDEQGLRERTVVVYVSDNGWHAAPGHGAFLDGPRGKLTLYELGFRTPLVLSWPGVLPAGLVDDRLVATQDLFATLVDLAGAELPAGRRGRSLAPLLFGAGDFQREFVAGGIGLVRNDEPGMPGGLRRERAWFLRTREWRLAWYPELDREELYRVEEDPLEERDLAAEHPEQTARMHATLETWIEGAAQLPEGPDRRLPVPDANPSPKPARRRE